jgi:hypothetical protein
MLPRHAATEKPEALRGGGPPEKRGQVLFRLDGEKGEKRGQVLFRLDEKSNGVREFPLQ